MSPPLYHFGQYLVRSNFLPQLDPFLFSQYFNRCVMLLALILLWPLLRWMGFHSRQDLGLIKNYVARQDFIVGSGIAAIGLLAMASVLVLQDAAMFRGTAFLPILFSALVTAGFVSVFEEFLFRGVFLGIFKKHLPRFFALIFLSSIFSILHFVKPHRWACYGEDIVWYSGFKVLLTVFDHLASGTAILGGFISLFLVGFILGWTVLKTKSLFFAMGLHFGWVFSLKIFTLLVKRISVPTIWFGQDLRIGIAPVILLLLSLAICWFYLQYREKLLNQA